MSGTASGKMLENRSVTASATTLATLLEIRLATVLAIQSATVSEMVSGIRSETVSATVSVKSSRPTRWARWSTAGRLATVWGSELGS